MIRMNESGFHRATVVLLALCALSGCGQAKSSQAATPAAPLDAGPPPKPTIVALGDSLTAGQGLPLSQAFPSVLQDKLNADGLDVEVENAGVSGDTTAGGLRRLDWALGANVRILIVALGANDALRGISPADTKKNLAAIIEAAQAKHIAVLLAGMEAPPNLGTDYKTAFHQIYPALADQYHDVVFVPFLLEGVAGKPELNQADGIHPNEKGAEIIAELIYSKIHVMVDEALGPGRSTGR